MLYWRCPPARTHKKEEMIALAEECGIVVMRSTLRAFEACGILYARLNGAKKGDAS